MHLMSMLAPDFQSYKLLYIKSIYTVNHKKGGSTFVIITLENLDRFL